MFTPNLNGASNHTIGKIVEIHLRVLRGKAELLKSLAMPNKDFHLPIPSILATPPRSDATHSNHVPLLPRLPTA